jgi:hypothetical protein
MRLAGAVFDSHFPALYSIRIYLWSYANNLAAIAYLILEVLGAPPHIVLELFSQRVESV